MKLKVSFNLLKIVIEDLFKYKILIFMLSLGTLFSDDLEYEPLDYVFPSVIPLEISNTSFGFRLLDSENLNNTYLNYHSWVTENLYIDGFVSPTTNNTVQVTYGMNLGYGVKFNSENFKSIYYSLGYYSKKFVESKQKWSNLSITPVLKFNQSWFLFSFNYSFDYDDDNRVNRNSLIIDYLKSITNTLIFRYGLQILDNDNEIDLNILTGLSYKL